MGFESEEAIENLLKELLEVGFIRDIYLNKACTKDPFVLPCIDKLVGDSAGCKYLSFKDADSSYNQIPTHPIDQDKTALIMIWESIIIIWCPLVRKVQGPLTRE
jgi:hypothetical protein